MLRRVRVRDFQALADVDLKLGVLTVIVGPSNSGKSGLIRAMQAALFNRQGGNFVRDGRPEAWVQMDFDAGALDWKKPPKGGALYAINGREMARMGGEIPEEIRKLTGVHEVVVDTMKVRLQFDSQFDPPFMLSHTSGQAAKMLARVSRIDVLVAAQVEARRDEGRAKVAAEAHEKEVSLLQAQLDVMPDFEALLAKWEALDERMRVAAEAERRTVAGTVLVRQRAENVRRLSIATATAGLAAEVRRLSAVADGLHVARDVNAKRAAAVTQLSAALANGQSAAGQILKLEAELEQALVDLVECPVCGRLMDAKR